MSFIALKIADAHRGSRPLGAATADRSASPAPSGRHCCYNQKIAYVILISQGPCGARGTGGWTEDARMADVFCTKPPDLGAWAAVRNGSRRAVLPAAGPGDYCNLKEKFALDLLQIQQPGSQMQFFCCGRRQLGARGATPSSGVYPTILPTIIVGKILVDLKPSSHLNPDTGYRRVVR